MVLIIGITGCAPANPNLRNMSNQTRLNDNTNNGLMNDRPLNTNNRLNTNLNNGMVRNNGLMNNDNMDNGLMNNNGNNMDNGLMNNSTNMNNRMVGDGNNSNSGSNVANNGNISSRANTIAKRVAALPEITSASVLINGNTAIVGCDVKGSTNNNLSANLRQKVEAAVKVADKNIKQVSITSDPSINTRIKTMSTNINNGNPISTFARDIEDILMRITTPVR